MVRFKEIYKVEQLPIFQNKVYDNQDDALSCLKCDVELVQDLESGLIYNYLFDPLMVNYGPDYQNEQSHSTLFKKHIEDVGQIICKSFSGSRLIEIVSISGGIYNYLVVDNLDSA